MTLESRIIKLEAGRPLARDPFAYLTPEQTATIAREFLLSEAARKEPDPTNEYIRWAMALLDIEPDGLAEWLRGYV